MGVCSPGGLEQAGGGQTGGKAAVWFWGRVPAVTPWHPAMVRPLEPTAPVLIPFCSPKLLIM